MLVLTRKQNEWVRIRLPDGRDVWVAAKVVKSAHSAGGNLKLVIDAPPGVTIDREECLPSSEQRP